MIAASLLVVAVTATYASLAMLSLSVSAPGLLLRTAGSVASEVGSVGWKPPALGAIIRVRNPSDVSSAGLEDVSSISIGVAHGAQTSIVAVGNPTTKPLLLRVRVVGTQTLGLTASFQTPTGESSTALVQPQSSALVTVVSNPLKAGPFYASLRISVPGSHITPKLVPIIGAQAPEAPGPVTATAAKGGAVELSWTPSPSSGVIGYIVKSSTGSSPYAQVGTITNATTAVEQTGTNATTFSYEVLAVAAGDPTPVTSLPGGVGSAQTDSEPPAPPTSVSINPPGSSGDINATNCGSIPVTVALAPSAQPGDSVTLTFNSSGGGQPLSQTYPGNSTFTVNSNLCSLPDGSVTASAIAADSLGNSTITPVYSPSVLKDTVPPGVFTVQSPTSMNSVTAAQFPVTIATDAPDTGDTVVVTLAGGSQIATGTSPVSPGGETTVDVDASALPDGSVAVSATITDVAGNTTTETGSNVTKITQGPTAPTLFGVEGGSTNPPNVINATSQTAVMIDAQFAQPTDPNDVYTLTIDHVASESVPAGVGTTQVTFGPLDLSGLPDGRVTLQLTMTDSNGNSTTVPGRAWKDTVAPTAPASVGVPAGETNPAGYVNSSTQTAATIVASFDAPTDSRDQIAISVGDDDSIPAQAGGSDQATWTVDLSGLPDGTLPITGTITDGAGNVTDFSGSLIKDTQAPPAAVAANVVGPPLNTITPQDASCVNVAVAFNVAVDPADNVTVTLSDSDGNTVQGSAQAGNGLVTVGCIDASSLAAGQITVSVTVTDVAGNSTTSEGTTATKLPPCDHHGGGGGGGGEGSGSGGSGGGGSDG